MSPPNRPLGRVLVVEDDPILLDQLTWALKGSFDVVGAKDADAGRALLGSEPDLFLFDLRLPPTGRVEEGFALLEETRRRNPDATVVMMSGESDRSAALHSNSRLKRASDAGVRLRTVFSATRAPRSSS